MTQTKEFQEFSSFLDKKTLTHSLRKCPDAKLSLVPVELVEFLDGAESAGSDLELDDGAGPVRQVRVAVQERADVGRDGVARTKDPGK